MDLISTTALAAADKRPAVSVTISVDFYAALPIGEELEIESHVVKTGKSLTFAEVIFRYSRSHRGFLDKLLSWFDSFAQHSVLPSFRAAVLLVNRLLCQSALQEG